MEKEYQEPLYMKQAKKYFKKKYGKDMTPSRLNYAPFIEKADYMDVRKKMKENQEKNVELGAKRYGNEARSKNYTIDIQEKLLRRRAKKQFKTLKYQSTK